MATLLLALPAFPLDAGGPPCALADARAQAACEITNRPGTRERHLARMAKCDFKTEPGITLLLLSATSFYNPSQRGRQLRACASSLESTIWRFRSFFTGDDSTEAW